MSDNRPCLRLSNEKAAHSAAFSSGKWSTEQYKTVLCHSHLFYSASKPSRGFLETSFSTQNITGSIFPCAEISFSLFHNDYFPPLLLVEEKNGGCFAYFKEEKKKTKETKGQIENQSPVGSVVKRLSCVFL